MEEELVEVESGPSRYERALETLAPKINPNPKHSRAVLERLYRTNYQHARDEASVPGLPIQDIAEILSHTAGSLSWYEGEDDDAGFRSWLTDVLREATTNALAFVQMRDDPVNQSFVNGAIGKIVWSSKDLGVDLGDPKKGIESPTVKELAHEVWTLIRAELSEWLVAGKPYNPEHKIPKLTSRLTGKARKHALGWRKKEIGTLVRLGIRPKPKKEKEKEKATKAKLTKEEKQALKVKKAVKRAASPRNDESYDLPIDYEEFDSKKKRRKSSRSKEKSAFPA